MAGRRSVSWGVFIPCSRTQAASKCGQPLFFRAARPRRLLRRLGAPSVGTMAQEHDRKQLCVVRSTAALAHSMPSWTKVLKHAACPARASALPECYNCESRAAAPATRGRRIPPAHFPRHQWATHAASAELRAVPTQRNKMGASWRALLSRRLPALTPTGTVCLASAREAG